MHALILQLQMLLAALSAFLPLVPNRSRERAAEILQLAADALAAGGAVAINLNDLAEKLSVVRAEVEAMARTGRAVTPEELDGAIVRVRTASEALRTALRLAEEGG